MEAAINPDHQNNVIVKEGSKCAHHHSNLEDHKNDPPIESRIPLPAKFEEEGTQTENSNNEFLYESPENDLEEGHTILQTTNMTRSLENPESRLRESDSISTSSSQISNQNSYQESHVRCNFIQSSSNSSESGDSVIERLSKGVSRLLKPVSILLIVFLEISILYFDLVRI